MMCRIPFQACWQPFNVTIPRNIARKGAAMSPKGLPKEANLLLCSRLPLAGRAYTCHTLSHNIIYKHTFLHIYIYIYIYIYILHICIIYLYIHIIVNIDTHIYIYIYGRCVYIYNIIFKYI